MTGDGAGKSWCLPTLYGRPTELSQTVPRFVLSAMLVRLSKDAELKTSNLDYW